MSEQPTDPRDSHVVEWTLEGQREGEQISPTNFDVPSVLAAAAAYLKLLVWVADDADVPLHFRGLGIKPGSVRLCAIPDRPDVARLVVQQADRYISGMTPVPRGAKGRVDSVVNSLRLVEKEYSVNVSIGKYTNSLNAPRLTESSARVEVSDIRARLIQVSIDPPAARFRTDRFGSLRLTATEEQARQLGAALGQTVDVVAEISLNPDGKVDAGHLLDFTPVINATGDDELEIWKKWFSDAGSGWTEVGDIEKELRIMRGDDGGVA